MGKKYVLCIILAVILFNPAFAPAQNGSDQQSYDGTSQPGMETRKVNKDVSIIMPEGGKFYRRNQTTYVQEPPDEYAARKFADVYSRLKKLEEVNKELINEINYLKMKIILQENKADKDVPKIPEE
ncbi:MAG: hypothetical protein PHX20_03195 [Candidatus Omnitrophica bacterium]|nr:hypothetical protein [Candidatus Omnitrophota bacterium]MDD5436530.1 hypothetical protein [Candidatus Omnitrophota bacterium]